jgi:DNA-binding LacI/PurR family transcriptional regulator
MGRSSAAVPKFSKWEQAKRAMQKDLFEGHFQYGKPAGNLKNLASRYGICYHTLLKALDSLVKDRVIIRKNNEYVFADVAITRSSPILVILSGPDNSGDFFMDIRNHEFLFTLEQECADRSITIAEIIFSHDERGNVRFATATRTDASDLIRSESVIGYIILTEVQHDLLQVVPALCRWGKPVAVLDESGDVLLPDLNPRKDRLAVFRIACTARPGLAVGRFMMGLGHRRVAYISPYYRNSWAVNRCAGLMAAYDAAGLGCNVQRIEAEEYFSVWHLAGVRGPEYRARSSSYLKDMESIKRKVERILHAYPGEIPDYVLRRITNIKLQCSSIDTEYAERQYTEPLFEKTLAQNDITAWVCENDGIALLGWNYCLKRRVRIPHDISIIGFDNTPESLLNGLSTYSFNLPVAARSMLSFIINPRSVTLSHMRTPIDIDGMVIKRGTTARARNRPRESQVQGI